MQTYIITVKHDAGKIRITANAFNKKTAITQVMIAEGCPRTDEHPTPAKVKPAP